MSSFIKKYPRAANGLKKLGIKKGDRVTIYLTMIPELGNFNACLC